MFAYLALGLADDGKLELDKPLHPRLPYCAGEVVWAVRQEMARTVEDVLARRTRALLLDTRASVEIAPGCPHISVQLHLDRLAELDKRAPLGLRGAVQAPRARPEIIIPSRFGAEGLGQVHAVS